MKPVNYVSFIIGTKLKMSVHKPIWGKLGKCIFTICFLLMFAASFAFPFPAFAQKGSEFILFGPYISLSAGKYKVSYRLKVGENKDKRSIASLSIVANQANKLFVFRDLKGTDFAADNEYQDFDLEFDTFGGRDFEFRVRYFGNREFFVDRITLTRLENWPQQEAVGGSLVMGSAAPEVVNEKESFLGSARSVEIEALNPIFRHRGGEQVVDLKASCREALLAPMANVDASSTEGFRNKTARLPKIEIPEVKVPKPRVPNGFAFTSQFYVGLGLGALLTAIFMFFGRRLADIWLPKRGKHAKKSPLLAVDWRLPSWSQKRSFSKLLNKYTFSSAFLIVAVGSIFFESISVSHFVIRTEYFLLLFLFFSVVFVIDSRFSMATALILLAICSFLVAYGYLELAEKVAIYVYYFLLMGITLQIVEYVKESRRSEELAAQRIELKHKAQKQKFSSLAAVGSELQIRKAKAYLSRRAKN